MKQRRCGREFGAKVGIFFRPTKLSGKKDVLMDRKIVIAERAPLDGRTRNAHLRSLS